MKKIIALAISLLMICSVFSSCASKSENYGDVFNKKWEVPSENYSFSELNIKSNFNCTRVSANLALFEKWTNGDLEINVYNLETKERIYEEEILDDELEFYSFEFFYNYFIVKLDDLYTLYSVIDNKFETLKSGADHFYTRKDLIVLDNEVFRIDLEDGSLLYKFERSALMGEIPHFDNYTDEYFFLVEDDYIVVYDKHCIRNGIKYLKPANTESFTYITLGNGTLIIQYIEILPEDASDYDMFIDGIKFSVSSFTMNPKSGSLSKYKTDYYYIYSVSNNFKSIADAEYMNKKAKNLVVGYLISEINSARYFTADSYYFIAVNKSGKIVGAYRDVYDISHIGSGIYVGNNANDETIFFDEKGVVLCEGEKILSYNSKYIAMENKVYNFKSEVVQNLDGYKYDSTLGNCFVYCLDYDDEDNYDEEIIVKLVIADGTVLNFEEDIEVCSSAEGFIFFYAEGDFYDSNGKVVYSDEITLDFVDGDKLLNTYYAVFVDDEDNFYVYKNELK